MKTKTTFDTSSAENYRFTHGHMPKGTGNWSFGLARAGAWTEFRFFGTYGNAKAAAMREARSLGCDTVTVNT